MVRSHLIILALVGSLAAVNQSPGQSLPESATATSPTRQRGKINIGMKAGINMMKILPDAKQRHLIAFGAQKPMPYYRPGWEISVFGEGARAKRLGFQIELVAAAMRFYYQAPFKLTFLHGTYVVTCRTVRWLRLEAGVGAGGAIEQKIYSTSGEDCKAAGILALAGLRFELSPQFDLSLRSTHLFSQVAERSNLKRYTNIPSGYPQFWSLTTTYHFTAKVK